MGSGKRLSITESYGTWFVVMTESQGGHRLPPPGTWDGDKLLQLQRLWFWTSLLLLLVSPIPSRGSRIL